MTRKQRTRRKLRRLGKAVAVVKRPYSTIKNKAPVVQRSEQSTHNAFVVGSNPAGGTI